MDTLWTFLLHRESRLLTRRQPAPRVDAPPDPVSCTGSDDSSTPQLADPQGPGSAPVIIDQLTPWSELDSQSPARIPESRGEVISGSALEDPVFLPLNDNLQQAATGAPLLNEQLQNAAGLRAGQPMVLDLNHLLTSLEKGLPSMVGRRIRWAVLPGQGLGRVNADPRELEQLLAHLVLNAREAMPEGGTLTLETTNVQLEGSFYRQYGEFHPGHYVLLTVSDTGTGMSPQTRAHAFQPFFTTHEERGAAGLGLSIVHGIVRQSGGQIRVFSQPGVGTSFEIYLPRVDTVEVAEKLPTPVVRGQPCRRTVLLVEDDAAVRALVSEILEKCGYRVLSAADGPEALEEAASQERPIDLVLTDLFLPSMKGRELVKQLMVRYPGLRVLYMSGCTAHVMVERGFLKTRTAFLRKPFTANRLLDALDAALNNPACNSRQSCA